MKKYGIAFTILGMLLLLGGCATKTDLQKEQTYVEKIPVINAYYEGEEIWFVHTDVTDQEMAERLTKMTDYRTVYAPSNLQAVDSNKLAKFYVFTNGIDHAGEEPWGGGPFGYQIDIFESVPGDEGYTSWRMPYAITWNDDAKPRILKSTAELKVAEANDELTIEPTGVVVNVPVVRWPGGDISQVGR